MATKPKLKLVAVSEKTGKVLKSPRKGMLVRFALQKGRTKPIPLPAKFAQDYTKKDFDAIAKIIAASDGKNFVFYERFTKKVIRDKKGKPVLKAKSKTALRETKITGHTPKAKERPVLFTIQKKVVKRVQQDHAFVPRTKRQLVDQKLLKVLKVQPGEKPVWTKEIFLRGPSIFSTLRNIKVNVTGKELKKHGANAVFTEGTLRVYSPTKGRITAVNFSVVIESLAAFSRTISRIVRYKLLDVGYRFTSLFELQKYQDEIEERSGGEHPINLFYPSHRKDVLDVQPVVPESAPEWEGEGDLGIGRRLAAGGRRKISPQAQAVMQVSVALRITGYRDVTRKKKTKKAKKK